MVIQVVNKYVINGTTAPHSTDLILKQIRRDLATT